MSVDLLYTLNYDWDPGCVRLADTPGSPFNSYPCATLIITAGDQTLSLFICYFYMTGRPCGLSPTLLLLSTVSFSISHFFASWFVLRHLLILDCFIR